MAPVTRIQQVQRHHICAENIGTPHPIGLSRQEMFEKGLFARFESAPDIDDYPPVEIETHNHRARSDDATISTLVKYDVVQSMEARDASNKK